MQRSLPPRKLSWGKTKANGRCDRTSQNNRKCARDVLVLMRVRVTYVRQDGKPHTSAEYNSAQTSFGDVLAEVRANRLQQGKSAGLSGRADCYQILVDAQGQRAIVHATAPTRETNLFGDVGRAGVKQNSQQTQRVDYRAQRKTRPLDELLPATLRWADSLSDSAKPYQLMKTYPRVANRVANAWRDGRALSVLDELLVDRRGGRRGFPAFVLAELLALRELLDHGHSSSSR